MIFSFDLLFFYTLAFFWVCWVFNSYNSYLSLKFYYLRALCSYSWFVWLSDWNIIVLICSGVKFCPILSKLKLCRSSTWGLLSSENYFLSSSAYIFASYLCYFCSGTYYSFRLTCIGYYFYYNFSTAASADMINFSIICSYCSESSTLMGSVLISPISSFYLS